MKAARFLAVAAAVAGAVAVLAVAVPYGTIHFLGIDTQQSDNYDFTSGIGPMLITSLGFTTLITGAWHHLNCHAAGCMRIGRFPVAGGQFKVCGRHHRAITGHSRLTLELLHRLHAEHRQEAHGAAPSSPPGAESDHPGSGA